MKLEYTGPRGHRRVDGRPLKEGEVIDVEGKATIEYFLGLRLNDGEPEFKPVDAQPHQPIEIDTSDLEDEGE